MKDGCICLASELPAGMTLRERKPAEPEGSNSQKILTDNQDILPNDGDVIADDV
jgi:hypothetical protein